MIKRKLHFLKLGILFFGISLLLLNCIDENNIDLNENLSIEQVNDFQSIETDEAKNLINNIVTKNKNQFQKGGFSVTIDEKSLYFSEVKKTNLNIPTFSASVKPNIHSKVFMVKKQDSVYTCLYNYIPFENKNADFLSGAIIISTIDGAFINGYKVIDGVFVSQYKQETNRETAPKTFRKDAEPNDDWWDLGSLEEISLTLSGAGGGSIFFTNFYNPVSNQGWMNLNLSGSLFGGAGGGNPNGGNGGSSNSGEMPLFPCDNPTPRGCEEADDQIFNELTGKAKCIYDKLKEVSSDFKNMIKRFDGEFPVSHLKLSINNNIGSNTYGITMPPVNYVTEIQINGNRLSNLSDIGVATTLAHELIHAEIFRKMLSAAQQGDLNTNNMTNQQALNYVNSLKDNFPGLYNYYVEKWHPTWNHNMMATHYRTIIANIIEDFDKKRLSRSIYEDIAWAGLGELENNQSTFSWQNLTSNNQESIRIVINNYFFNGISNCN